jgi:hypothetical protein
VDLSRRSEVKVDPYNTPLQRRIDLVLVLLTIAIFAILIIGARKSHGTANQNQLAPAESAGGHSAEVARR